MLAKCPELAGLFAGELVSETAFFLSPPFSGLLSLVPENPFLAGSSG
jgi:hypothetical protein